MRLAALALILAAAAPAQQPVAVFFSPRDYQVFQRETLTAGTILVNGIASVPCDAVEARAGDGPWIAIRFGPGQSFFGKLAAQAGGWYAVQVRFLMHGNPVAVTAIPRVGVGEVFVIAGQSNSTNYGEEKQHSVSGMVSSFDGDTWRPADDPQRGVQDSSKNGSFIPAFGDALYDRLHVPIGVACVGAGSTSVRQWLPRGEHFATQPTMTKYAEPAGAEWQSTGDLFDGLIRRIQHFGDHGFRALLWHQGESDAHQPSGHEISAAEYRSLMERLIRASRVQTGWDFPWFVAQVSYHKPDDSSAPEIRAAQAELWRSGIALEGPDTDKLGPEYRQDNGRGVHFNASGLQAHGRLWAEKVAAYLGRQ